MRVTCPKCLKHLQIDADAAVSSVTCPYCRTTLDLSLPARQVTTRQALGDGPSLGSPKPSEADVSQSAAVRRVAPSGNLMHCPDCAGLVSRDARACPRCGAPVAVTIELPVTTIPVVEPPALPSTGTIGKSYRGTAVAGFVCSLLGIFLVGLILGLIGLILAASASSGMARSGNNDGRGLATAGIVLGIIDIAGWVVAMAMLL